MGNWVNSTFCVCGQSRYFIVPFGLQKKICILDAGGTRLIVEMLSAENG